MAIMEILHFPDPRLREKASTVDTIDQSVHRLIENMFETMYDAPGVGLAATQVGVAKRIAVIDVSEEKDQPRVLINPQILSRDGEATVEEGCLSVPGHYDSVKRAQTCRVRAQDRDGQVFELDGEELLAQCLQHEVDHLDGRLYIDQLSELKRSRIRRRLLKEQRQTARS